MNDVDLIVRADRVVTDDGIRPASVGVRDGRITAISDRDGPASARHVLELAEDEVLLPGLVDTHVHVNEPGRTDWEGFATATRAAAAGGVTTLVDMPLNSIPPTVDPGALEVKRASARDQIVIDVGFWGGAVPGSLGHLAALWDRGVYGFKCFLLPSGVEEFPPLDLPQLDRVMAEVAGFGGLLVVHAEDAATIAAAPTATGDRYADFLSSRPAEAEDRAIAVVIDRAAAHGTRVHVLHLSSAGSLDQISRARAAGVRLTAETCPHYLTIDAAQIGTGQTAFKCCPPIRDAANCDRLWSGLRDGTIDCVVTDHSPSPPALKALDRGDFGDAWGGISSLQLGLPLVWTAGRRRGHDLGDLVGWMARRPAEVAGLRGKGRIAPGFDGDFSVFAPDETFTVDPAQLHHRHPVTPYAGRRLTGVVRSTWLRGECVRADRPTGQLLTREEPDDS